MPLSERIEVNRRATLIRSAVFLHDALLAGLAYLAAVALRYGSLGFPMEKHVGPALLMVAIAAGVNWLVGLNRGVWRYASLSELVGIIQYAAVTVLVFSMASFLLFRLEGVPRATVIMTFILMVVMTGALRIGYRIMRQRRAVTRLPAVSRSDSLLLGAHDNAELFIKAVRERPDLPYRLHGIIDDRNRRVGLSIHGVKVLAGMDGIEGALEAVRRREGVRVQSIILTKARDKMSDTDFDRLLDVASRYDLRLLRLPELSRMTSVADTDEVAPRPVQLEDLLSRPPAKIDSAGLEDLIQGSVVLVTGAGGSIGSELCRQVLCRDPAHLVLVDHSEFLLFTIEQELRGLQQAASISSRLGDVRNRSNMRALLREFKPDLVVHAAALKHVPIVESQPLEGLHTNTIGTRHIADACVECGVTAMVLVSTDKAVNPANVMGASKRLAEMYCQSLDVSQKTRFVTVRFGNVLGSAGSVVPIFEKQIAAGGPVTVTHPEIERFFMTIPEAVSLVLHATADALNHESARGNIFVLDMGRPVRIAEMARKLIQLSGRRPDEDIKIVYTGLRPGEKLYEELFTEEETPVATGLPGVRQAAPAAPGHPVIAATIDELRHMIERNDVAGALRTLGQADCHYQPGAAVSGVPAPSKVLH